VIVERLLRGAPVGTRAAFLLQREVVERMVARAGEPAYGALSLHVATRARARRLGLVRPGAFVPPPRVDSAFVGLETVAPPLPAPAMAELERLIAVAFGQRRKSLRNALAAGYGRPAADAALAGAGIAPARRAEELDLAAFLALLQAFGELAGAG
jgi:16S rRNA (adenine1518-N6/adenine1519-N6)-dimethyltransferase